MLLAPTMQSILQAASTGESSVLQLQFRNPSSNTSLQISEGQITGVRSSVLPDWSTSLIQHGIHPAAVAGASLQGGSYVGALRMLIEMGQLTSDELIRITRDRVLAALLPIAWRDAATVLTPVSGQIPFRPLGSMDAHEAVKTTELHAAGLGRQARELSPSDCFLTTDLTPVLPESAGQELVQVFHLASQGLNLGEIARRLPLRWDILTEHILRLVAQEALRSASSAEVPAVGPQLSVGQIAPDFRLTDISGETLRLLDLRGQPVWLLFNRQATCALCNPHHAQIIAMSEHLRARGVQIVSIWGSTVEDLHQGIGALRPPYPVLADPEDSTYDQYGLTMSLRGFLDVRNLPTMLQGVKMVGKAALKSDGELLRMPAEFLIGPDGSIQEAHYNSYGTDWLPMERVLAWADSLPRQT